MAMVGEPELSMFLPNHNHTHHLMDWSAPEHGSHSLPRIMNHNDELVSSSYMTSSDPYSSQQLFFSNISVPSPFDTSDSFHVPKAEPISNSAEYDYYGPPQITSQNVYHHGSGVGSSFNHPQHQAFISQPAMQQHNLHEEIDGMLKGIKEVPPARPHHDLDMDPQLLFGDLVPLPHQQPSLQPTTFYGSQPSSLGMGLSGLDGGSVVSHQMSRSQWTDPQAVLRELQEQMLFDTAGSSMDTQSMSSDASTMTFASSSESVMSTPFYPEVARGHVGMSPSPTSLRVSGSLKIGSPSSPAQQRMAFKPQQMVLKKQPSLRMSSPGLGVGYGSGDGNLSGLFRPPPSPGFGSSSSHSPLPPFRQSPTPRLPPHLNHLTEQILPGTSVPASGLQLVHMLLACAEAVAENKFEQAEVILARLRDHVLPDGNPMQRLAAYFEQALTARLRKENGLPKFQGMEGDKTLPQAEVLEAFSVYYDCIPIGKFGHLTCNQILLDAVERESIVHVLDLHIWHGMQWPAFLQALALRGGEPPKLRLSAVGSDATDLQETGEKLTECAKNLKVPFEFCPILSSLEEFKADMVEVRRGECLVVNSFVQFHSILNKGPNSVQLLLNDLRRLNPRVLAFAENDGNHNSNKFLTRFVECLRYYSAVFDAFDASLPPDSPARMKMEEIFAAQKIRNCIACEGPARVEGSETMKFWHKTMEGAHFRSVPLSSRAISQAHLLLNLYYSNGYTLNTSDHGYLALGWHGMPLTGVSAWH